MNLCGCLGGGGNCGGVCDIDVGINSGGGRDNGGGNVSRSVDCERGSLDSASTESGSSRTLSPWEIMAFFIFMTAFGFLFAMLTMKWLQDKGII